MPMFVCVCVPVCVCVYVCVCLCVYVCVSVCMDMCMRDLYFNIQVKDSSGEYVTVPHIDNALQVNIGGIMQRWTADQYIAPVS